MAKYKPQVWRVNVANIEKKRDASQNLGVLCFICNNCFAVRMFSNVESQTISLICSSEQAKLNPIGFSILLIV